MNELDLIKSYISAIALLGVTAVITRRYLDRLGVLRPLLRVLRALGRAVRELGRRRGRRRVPTHRKVVPNIVRSRSRKE